MGTVIVRAPTKGEVEQTAYVSQMAFDTPSIDGWLRSYTWIAENPGLDYLVVVEADGEIVSSMVCTPANVMFGKDLLPFSAVGGVGTLPECRKYGYAGLMMEYAVRMFRDKGIVTSALWPFSYHYYRKFGWEISSEHRKYTLTPEVVAGLGAPDGVRPAEKSDQPAISQLVHRQASGHSCLTVRDETWWSCIDAIYGLGYTGEPDHRKRSGPWVHDGDGSIDAYAYFGIEGEGENEHMYIRELFADTPAARRSLLAGLAQSGVPKVFFPAPMDDDFIKDLPNPRLITANIEGGFQFRVIDPAAALNMRSVDDSISGRIGFTITDCVLGVFDFYAEVSDGRVLTGNSCAGERLTMDVQTFSQLFTGYLSATKAAELGRVQSTSESALQFADRVLSGYTPFRSLLELG